MSDKNRIDAFALKCLARREHSTQELQQKLEKKGFDLTEVAATLAGLTQKNLLSDARFAEMYARMRWRRGYGPLRIQLELQQRGVSVELIAMVLAHYDSQLYLQIEQVRRKRFGKALPKTIQQRAQQMRFLQYRGFFSEQIRMVFSNDDDNGIT